MSKYNNSFVGYERVSSKDQNLSRQTNALVKYGVNPRHIFKEKVSGSSIKDRPEIQELIRYINSSNTVVVEDLDRLSRNYDDIKRLVHDIRAKHATLVVLSLPTFRQVKNSNLRKFLDDLIIDIYAYQSQQERLNIRSRQAQGIVLAKKNGVYKGRKRQYHLSDKNVKRAIHLYQRRSFNKLSVSEIVRMTKMSRPTFYREYHKYLDRNMLKFEKIGGVSSLIKDLKHVYKNEKLIESLNENNDSRERINRLSLENQNIIVSLIKALS